MLTLVTNECVSFWRYYEGGVSSVYLWDLDHGFAGVILIKKGLKCILTWHIFWFCMQLKLTTKSDCVPLVVSGVDTHGHVLEFQELAANSGSSWMSQAPNLHFSNAVVKGNYTVGCTEILMSPWFKINGTSLVRCRSSFCSRYMYMLMWLQRQ